jgi:hypothetical protein
LRHGDAQIGREKDGRGKNAIRTEPEREEKETKERKG